MIAMLPGIQLNYWANSMNTVQQYSSIEGNQAMTDGLGKDWHRCMLHLIINNHAAFSKISLKTILEKEILHPCTSQ